MLRRPSVPKLLRAPSLVDQPAPFARRPSFAGEKTFKVPEHPDDKALAPRRGSGLLAGSTGSFSNLLAPGRFSAQEYDPELSMTQASDDDNNHHPDTLFSTEETTPVPTTPAAIPKAPVTKPIETKPKPNPKSHSPGFALTEDKWSNMTEEKEEKPKLYKMLQFWKKKRQSPSTKKGPDVDDKLQGESKTERDIRDGLDGTSNQESTAATPPRKIPVVRRVAKSIGRTWHKLEDWVSYQRFLLGRRRDGNQDFDELESVYSGFTTPSIPQAQ